MPPSNDPIKRAQDSFGLLASWSERGQTAAKRPPTQGEITQKNTEAMSLLEWLASNSDDLAESRIRTLIKVLKLTYDEENAARQLFFEEDVIDGSQNLVAIWEVTRLNGANTDVKGRDIVPANTNQPAAVPVPAPGPSAPARRRRQQGPPSGKRIPRADHPHFGHGAPLDGIAFQNGVPILNPTRGGQRGNFKRFGNANLQV
jgi:hypothetical protein